MWLAYPGSSRKSDPLDLVILGLYRHWLTHLLNCVLHTPSVSRAWIISFCLIFFSILSTLPSHSVQHSPPPRTPSSYHRSIMAAVLDRSFASSIACNLCSSSTLASLGSNAIKEAECSAAGIGKSCSDVNRDAVVGYVEAQELTTARSSAVVSDVGISSGAVAWNGSPKRASISEVSLTQRSLVTSFLT